MARRPSSRSARRDAREEGRSHLRAGLVSIPGPVTCQLVAVETGKAAYQNAKLTREVAEIAVVEYQEGIFLQDLEDVEGDIKVAEAELALAEEVLKAAKDAGPRQKAGHQAGRAGYFPGQDRA